MFDALSDIPKEPLFYELGGIIFASALAGYAHTMRRLLYVVGRKGAWILPMLGAVLMLLTVGLHAYASFFLLPFVQSEGSQILLKVYQFRFVALLAMLASSAVTLAGALVLWFWVTGSRLSSST